jgi:hypothetical protein
VLRLLSWVAAAAAVVAAVGEVVRAATGADARDDWTLAVIFFALVAGGILALFGRSGRAPSVLLVAAGVLGVAFEYTYDDYYLPTKRRFADGGAVPVWWMIFLLVLALVAAARPRTTRWSTLPFALLFLLSLLFAGDGH